MSTKLYMKLKGARAGDIPGGCEVKGHENQIEIDDWNWNLTRAKKSSEKTNDAALTLKSGASSPSSVDAAEPSVFSFTKVMDMSSTKILNAMKTADLLSAEITLREHSGAYFELVVTLEKIRVLEYSLDGQNKDAGGSLDEKWVFNYESITFKHVPDKKKGALSVTLTRDPRSSTQGPQSMEVEEMMALARKISPEELTKLIPKLTEASKEAAAQKKPPQPQTGAASGPG